MKDFLVKLIKNPYVLNLLLACLLYTSKLGFPEVKMTKNYIFCSYFGERLTREKLKTLKPRNLLIFDHQGNLLKNLRSKRSLGKFTVSEDEKTIYAATEEPEVAIIRFDISNILK